MSSKDLGDFQTPRALVSEVLAALTCDGTTWARVLEPTCGQGNFIAGALDLACPPRELQAIEIQETYVEAARRVARSRTCTQVAVRQANIFDLHLGRDLYWKVEGPLLVVGNPPWVTNSELGALGSNNLPKKSNLKGLTGFEAITGSSNFDITEFIWLKLIRELVAERPTIALLCKTQVARSVMQFAAEAGLPVGHASLRRIDARRWFGAAVDACLFRITVVANEPRYELDVYDDLNSVVPSGSVSVVGGRLVSNTGLLPELRVLDGASPHIWRQGLKHDAASVVELHVDQAQALRNKRGEIVDVEQEFVYPLLKSSDLGGRSQRREQRAIIVPQQRVGQNTSTLAETAPKLWNYLLAHQLEFMQRKSSIYRNQPQFGYFGIGNYSFAPFKVAIAGLYKQPKFMAVGPVQSKPVMFDDTCYFIPCATAEQTAMLSSLLNTPLCLQFVDSIAFWDAKRPITKRLLQRIDLVELLDRVDRVQVLRDAGTVLAKLTNQQGAHFGEWTSALETTLLEEWSSTGSLITPSLWV